MTMAAAARWPTTSPITKTAMEMVPAATVHATNDAATPNPKQCDLNLDLHVRVAAVTLEHPHRKGQMRDREGGQQGEHWQKRAMILTSSMEKLK